MEATVCCRFYYLSETKLFEQKSLCRAPTLAQSSNCYWSGMGVTAMVECIMQLGFTVAMWQRSEIWLVRHANFEAGEVTFWTRGSSQDVSPMGTRLGCEEFLVLDRVIEGCWNVVAKYSLLHLSRPLTSSCARDLRDAIYSLWGWSMRWLQVHPKGL